MIDARVLLRSLVGEPLETARGRPNTVLEVQGSNATVATTRSPSGRPVPIEWLQAVLDRLRAGETVAIDPDEIRQRSSFLGAVLRTIPQVELLEAESPPRARLVPGAVIDDGTLGELERRLEMYGNLIASHSLEGIAPATLRSLGIYGGASGVWLDATRTRGVGGADSVAVGLLHTGMHYDDDLSDEALLYHYPDTARPPGRDRSEIEAMKAAGSLQLPVFVVLQEGARRSVRKGWVATWDDDEKVILVEFGAVPVNVVPGDAVDELPFERFEERKDSRRQTARARPNQQRFKVQVIQRYGARCAVCEITALELVTAAHLIPDADGGTSDPRNGLALCGTHHTALDRDLFAIDPLTTRVVMAKGHDASSLGIHNLDLKHLPAQPAPEALEYRWARHRE